MGKQTKRVVQKPKFDDKHFFVWLRSGLRSMSRRYPAIYEALAAAKEKYNVPQSSPAYNARQKFAYRCKVCDGTFPAKEVSIDHRVDCGSLKGWQDVQGFMERLFCKKDGLDILCHDCHDCKTLSTKLGISLEEAKIQKAVIALIKGKTAKQLLAYLQLKGYSGASVSNADKRRKLVERILKGDNVE